MSSWTIRAGGKKDLPSVFALIKKLAEFEKLTPPSASSLERFREHGFGRNRFFRMLVCEKDRQIVSYAFYFFTYSTFLAKPTLYLEDIFVLPEFRKHGVGDAMLRVLAMIAKRNRCGRMEWCVLDWNVNAIRFYNRRGAKHMKEWFFYRLDQKGIEKLAR